MRPMSARKPRSGDPWVKRTSLPQTLVYFNRKGPQLNNFSPFSSVKSSQCRGPALPSLNPHCSEGSLAHLSVHSPGVTGSVQQVLVLLMKEENLMSIFAQPKRCP